jgi:hypothetical protein
MCWRFPGKLAPRFRALVVGDGHARDGLAVRELDRPLRAEAVSGSTRGAAIWVRVRRVPDLHAIETVPLACRSRRPDDPSGVVGATAVGERLTLVLALRPVLGAGVRYAVALTAAMPVESTAPSAVGDRNVHRHVDARGVRAAHSIIACAAVSVRLTPRS